MSAHHVNTKPGQMLRVLPVPAPWEALMLKVEAFPVPEGSLPSVRQFLQRFSDALRQEWCLSLHVFLQLFCLEHVGGSQVLSSHGREWLPKLGLGVWPDRPAPTFWRKEDFESLGPGEKPRTLMYQVMRITKSDDARLEACKLLQASGSTIQVWTTDAGSTFLDRAREVLLPPIKDPSFTCFPFYVPLLDCKSLEGVSADQLEQWSCGASVYIRESLEDTGVLLISKPALRPILEKLAGRFDHSRSTWTIPQ